jgi:hypothetical protein
MVMQDTSTKTVRAGRGSGLTWWAAAGFTAGLAALLALVMIASATPVDAVAARTGELGPIGRDFFGGELGLRFAGVLIFVLVALALFAQSSRHTRMLEASERQHGSRPHE